MFGRVAQGVEQRLGFDGGLGLQELHASLHVHVRRSYEGAVGVNVIVEDNQPDHDAQNQEMRLFALDL